MSKCTVCEDKFYGDTCNYSCPEHCKTLNCDRDEGTCPRGCTDDSYWGSKCENSCSSNCDKGKCVQDTGYCVYDCINSKWGNSCEYDCDEFCDLTINCNKTTGICYSCVTGHYGDYCKDICCGGEYPCQRDGSQCANCTAGKWGEKCDVDCINCQNECYQKTGKCVECKPGYYGEKCDQECNTHCITSETNSTKYCERNSGTCSYCEDGFYGDNCNIECSEGCNTEKHKCEKDGRCIPCNKKKWGTKCDSDCGHCIGEICDQSDGKCTDSTACEDNKYYGEYCNDTCSSLCKDGKCNINGKCLGCENKSMYGDDCQNSCNSGCDTDDGECDQSTGECTKCIKGYWGDSCEKECGSNCDTDEGECIKLTGECTKCKNGYWGTTCKENCGSNCDTDESNCDKDTGVCSKCKDNNYWGNKCQNNCSSNCARDDEGNICSKTDGTCKVCKDNLFYGPSCEGDCKADLSEHCKICDKDQTICTECDYSYWGNKCNKGCPENCKGQCIIDSGHCKECVNNHYGIDCESICRGCYGGCGQDGICTNFECLSGTYGLSCQNNCLCTEKAIINNNENSSNIADDSIENVCGKYSGECLSCKFGYFGTKCENYCYYLCKSPTCCIFHEQDDKNYIELKTTVGLNYINLTLDFNNENITTNLLIEADYTKGHRIMLFSDDLKITNENGKEISNNDESESDYFIKLIPNEDNAQIKEKELEYENFTVTKFFEIEDVKYNIRQDEYINITVYVAKEIKLKSTFSPKNNIQIHGVMGLGFFNEFSKDLLENEIIYRNVISYQYKNDSIEMTFGKLLDDVNKNFEYLSYCDLLGNTDDISTITNTKPSCKLDGMGFSNEKYGFEISNDYKNVSITFSIGGKTEIILGNVTNRTENNISYSLSEIFKNRYFEDTSTDFILKNTDQILKLPNLNFVINEHIYSFSADKLFDDNGNFTVKFNKSFTEDNFTIILGSDLLKNSILTINNEEFKIYFYTREQSYAGENYLKKDNYDNHTVIIIVFKYF